MSTLENTLQIETKLEKVMLIFITLKNQTLCNLLHYRREQTKPC